MFLKRVKVDDFRVLKNVDLTFEPDFVPSTFPLGSLNGGGKSTLLQLIFILLHCSFDEAKHQYLVNMLSENVKNKPDNFVLSQFELIHEDKEFSLEFTIVNSNASYDTLCFDTLFPEYDDVIDYLDSEIERANRHVSVQMLQSEISRKKPELSARVGALIKRMQPYHEILESLHNVLKHIDNTHTIREYVTSLTDISAYFNHDFMEQLKVHSDKISTQLHEQNIIYVTHVNSEKVLLCSTMKSPDFMRNISHKIFLAAPSTQVFLFLSAEEKKKLFSTENTYSSHIVNAKQNLQGLFAYDFASIPDIIDSFRKARDKDFSIALESGHYGDSLEKLRADLNSFLFGKSVVVDEKLSQVIFKLKETGEELSPEDLSHGELKKLGIYVWLKYQEIENALVLMDEIEIGLHPDWQYEIANELQEWSHGNQFILATHSYELCRALTPLHVKELLPTLIKK